MMTCSRCNKRFGRFVMEPHPSFAATGNDFTDDTELTLSCKVCLTDDEVERMFAPVVVFAVRRLMKRANATEMPGLNFAHADMLFKSGYDPDDRDIRELIRG